MERFEVGQNGTLAALVEAVERGEPVEIVRDGRTVADVVRRAPDEWQSDAFWDDFWRRARELREMIPPAARGARD